MAGLRVDTADRSITRVGARRSERESCFWPGGYTSDQTAVSNLIFTYLPGVAFYAYFQRILIVGSYKIVHSISLICITSKYFKNDFDVNSYFFYEVCETR